MADPNRIRPVPLPLRLERDRGEFRLPAPLTSFVGREREVVETANLLRRPDVRLVTLTGPGGVGKTRLALRVAEGTASDFADAGAFVPLAPVRDPALMASTVATAIGVPEVAGREPAEAVSDFLGDRRFLLVLDNLEHLLPAAVIVTSWLAACPRLTVLATSRAVLRVTGEHRFDLAPFDLPDLNRLPPAERLTKNPAVRLFVERARAARTEFALTPDNARTVAAICTRLDGLPLAIELAAARVQHLPLGALLDRLERRLPTLTGGPRDQPARLSTMRDAIAWSYDLLSPEERAFFRCLAVFEGGFTLEAAEHVRRAPSDLAPDSCLPSPVSVLDGIATLVSESLLRPEDSTDGEPRYQMLESVREFGLEQLAASGEEETVRTRHLAWVLTLAEGHRRGAGSFLDARWLDRMEQELSNVRAALTFAEQAGTVDLGLRLAGESFKLWQFRSHRAEGRRWLERALARDSGAPSIARGSALQAIGYLANSLGDRGKAVAYLDECLSLAYLLGDTELVQWATWGLAAVALDTGCHDERTATLLADSERAAAERGDVTGVAAALLLQACLAHRRSELSRADSLLGEALAIYRDRGHIAGVSWCLRDLGFVASDQGDYARAAALYADSLEHWRHVASQEDFVMLLALVALLAAAVGQSERAVRWLAAATALGERHGAVHPHIEQQRFDRVADDLRVVLGEAAYAAAWEAGRMLGPDEAIAETSAALAEPFVAAQAPRRGGGGAAGLTPREVEVLVLVAAGRSDREVAEALFLSLGTVRSHLSNIFGKLGVGSRTAAIAAARDLDIL
jgi:predicted ATPase/DNA-binding CsgD family transcriptional regulator